jgi:pimeloyl-ACP methyl ester carboxylesterase
MGHQHAATVIDVLDSLGLRDVTLIGHSLGGSIAIRVAAQFARTLKRWSSRGLHRTAVLLLADQPASFREQLAACDLPRRYISGARSNEDLGIARSRLRDTDCPRGRERSHVGQP